MKKADLYCGYCFSPLGESQKTCSSCNSSTEDVFEMGLTEYLEQARSNCRNCHQSILKLAILCRYCQHPVEQSPKVTSKKTTFLGKLRKGLGL